MKEDKSAKIIEEFPPTVYISEKHLKEINDWNVGDEYYVKMKIKQTSYSVNEGSKASAGFEILSIEPISKAGFSKQKAVEYMAKKAEK